MGEMKNLHRELSSCYSSCLLRIRSSGDGEGSGKGNGKQKRGREGGGRSWNRLETAQKSRCCNHHPILAATSIELPLAAGL